MGSLRASTMMTPAKTGHRRAPTRSRPRLITDVKTLPGARILDGQFTAVQQAVGTARTNRRRIPAQVRRGSEIVRLGRAPDRAPQGRRPLGGATRQVLAQLLGPCSRIAVASRLDALRASKRARLPDSITPGDRLRPRLMFL
jgi:hypothetical protein